MGISRPGSDAPEVSACTDGPWVGERRPEAQVEVAADSAEQRGLFQRRSGALGQQGRALIPLITPAMAVINSSYCSA